MVWDGHGKEMGGKWRRKTGRVWFAGDREERGEDGA